MTKLQRTKLNELKKFYKANFRDGIGKTYTITLTNEICIQVTFCWDNGLDFSIISHSFKSRKDNDKIEMIVDMLNSCEIISRDLQKIVSTSKEWKEYDKMIKNFVKENDSLAKSLGEDEHGFFDEHFLYGDLK